VNLDNSVTLGDSYWNIISNFNTIGQSDSELLMIKSIFTARLLRHFFRGQFCTASFSKVGRVTYIKFGEGIDLSVTGVPKARFKLRQIALFLNQNHLKWTGLEKHLGQISHLFTPCKIRGGWVKSLSRCLKFSLAPDLIYF